MALRNTLRGLAEVGGDTSFIEEFLTSDEKIIQSFHFLRDSIILTNHGIYVMDVQGLGGKRSEVTFFPKSTIRTISFQSGGIQKFSVIKIGVINNIASGKSGDVDAPLSFEVPKSQSEEAKDIIRLVKEYYLI